VYQILSRYLISYYFFTIIFIS